ncbi:hypothetical protein [Asticcacaulis endophyticus]|uniref:hypothetical protein n=1 Tax=Asticcacaulis endophyticus TaxID=1395890 RepID=UPI001679F4A0|nr:hypothetical protein [Asticcacaulis endophyticus]
MRSWSTGRRKPHPENIDRLRELYDTISHAALSAVEQIDSIVPDGAPCEIGYPSDDHEAQTLGYPCVGAWKVMAGMVIAELDRPVTLVPRGSTPASAAAMDAHNK